MRIQSLRVMSYRSWRVDEGCGPAARERLGKLELYEKLRAEGCSEASSLLAVGWSRATCYRWRWGMKARQPGELLQVDHMSVFFPGCSVKNFTAACPVTGYLVARAYSRATAANAARFFGRHRAIVAVCGRLRPGGRRQRVLLRLGSRLPGARHQSVRVVPPRSPKWNGCIERAHRSLREEFYATYRLNWRLDTLNRALAQFQHHYCAHRPHGGRGRDLRTPMASYQQLAEAA